MLTPYEVAVKTIIPAIRKELVRELYFNYNIKQREVAKLLDITQAAVSFYLTNSRGTIVNISKYSDVVEIIKKKAKKIYKHKPTPDVVAKYIIEISEYMIKNGYLCKYHKNMETIRLKKCDICI